MSDYQGLVTVLGSAAIPNTPDADTTLSAISTFAFKSGNLRPCWGSIIPRFAWDFRLLFRYGLGSSSGAVVGVG